MSTLFYIIFIGIIIFLNRKTVSLFSFKFLVMIFLCGLVFDIGKSFGSIIGNDYHSNDYYGNLPKQYTEQIESKNFSKTYQQRDLHWECTKLARASGVFTSPIHIFNEYFIVARKDDKLGLTNCYYRQIHHYNISDKYWDDYVKSGGQLEAN
jgi:hypothetical protein